MQEFMTLKILDRFKKIFNLLNIDYPTLRRILQIKFTLDARRTTIMTNRSTPGVTANMFKKTLMFYGFFGLFLAVFPFIGHLFISMSLFYGVIMFFLVTILISDFSEVLLDLKDTTIIGTKPVDKKTMNMAKYIHVVTYLTLIALSLSGFGIISFGVKFGIIVSIIMIVQLMVICSLTVILATLIYAVLLKFFDGEKLRDIINIFQIILATFMAVGYQVFVRMFRFIDLDMTFVPQWWSYFMPPVWFSSQADIMTRINSSEGISMLAIVGVVVPIIAIVLHIKVISRVFENNINKLNTTGSGNKKKPKWMTVLNHKIRRVMCRNNTEQAFFRFALSMYKSDRGIKLRVYPSIALGIFFPPIIAFFSFSDSGSLTSFIEMFSNTRTILMIYLTSFMTASIANMMNYTDSYKGRWVMKAFPIDHYENVIKGVNKAFIFYYLMPIYLVLSLLVLPFVTPERIIDILLIAFVALNSYLLVLKMNPKEMPFIKQYNSGEANKGAVFVNMGIIGAFVVIHFMMFYSNILKIIYLGVQAGILIFAWKTAFRLSKKDIEAIEGL